MGKQNHSDDAPPPDYPDQVHLDAGPVQPPAGPPPGHPGIAPSPAPSPYNQHGGFNGPANYHKPEGQQHLDPRAGPDPSQYGGSPAPPGHYYGPPAAGYYGQPPQGMYYGQPPPQHGPYGGAPYGYPPQQQGYYGQQRGYYDRRDDGLCAGLLGAMACCCCLDFLVF